MPIADGMVITTDVITCQPGNEQNRAVGYILLDFQLNLLMVVFGILEGQSVDGLDKKMFVAKPVAAYFVRQRRHNFLKLYFGCLE